MKPFVTDVDEQVRHSDEINTDETLYGKGPIVGYGIDLGFRVGADLGEQESWIKGSEYFDKVFEGWWGVSAGTGWGVRDMQFLRAEPLSEVEFNQIYQDAIKAGIDLQYMSQSGRNKWCEQVDEDSQYDFHYQKPDKE